MKLLICNCEQCKHGRRLITWKHVIQYKKGAYRSKVRQLLKNHNYELVENRLYIGYTDFV